MTVLPGMEATLWTVFPINLSTGHGMMTRSLFQLLRWEREFLFFDLMFRDKNFFLSILGFDTRRRIEIKTISARMFKNAIFACFCTDIFKKVCYVCLFSREMFMIFFCFFRREREYFSFNLVIRDENFFLSISCFKTRTRNRKLFLNVEQTNIKLILTRMFEIENSCQQELRNVTDMTDIGRLG